jgi:hypothetical protein
MCETNNLEFSFGFYDDHTDETYDSLGLVRRLPHQQNKSHAEEECLEPACTTRPDIDELSIYLHNEVIFINTVLVRLLYYYLLSWSFFFFETLCISK